MTKLKVFFDGSCHLCDREIKHYLKKDKKDLLIPINIEAQDFDASHYNLDAKEAQLHIHAIDEDGKIYTKIDTFIEIWKRIPRYHFAAKIASISFVKWIMDKCYIVFAQYIRPHLPKKDCSNNSCEL